MLPNRTLNSALLLSLIAGSLPLVAQVSTGALRGVVVDGAAKPLPGVKIILESPALFQPRTLVSNAKGEWIAELLPVGNYTVKAVKAGFLTRGAGQVRVGLGAARSLDFVLKPEAQASAVVEVIDDPSVLAKTADRVSVNFSAEDLQRLPVTMSAAGAVAMTAGVRPEGIRGGNQMQAVVRIDGIDVRNDVPATNEIGAGTAYDTAALYQALPDSIEDVEVVLANATGRNARNTGGSINVLTRTGSNTWAGSIRAFYKRNSWGGNGTREHEWELGSTRTDDLQRMVDVTLSGPIVKDKVWFALNSRLIPSTTANATLSAPPVDKVMGNLTTRGRNLNIDNVINRGPAGLWGAAYAGYGVSFMDAGAQVSYRNKSTRIDGKVTAQVLPDHTLTWAFMDTDQEGFGGTSKSFSYDLNTDFLRATHEKRTGNTLSWNGIFGSSLFAEASISTSTRRSGLDDLPSSVVGSNPVWLMFSDNRASGATTFGSRRTLWGQDEPNTRLDKLEIQAHIKKYLAWHGEHEVAFGIERLSSKYDPGKAIASNIWVGGWYYDQASGQALFPTLQFTTATNALLGQGLISAGVTGGSIGPAPTLEQGISASNNAENTSLGVYLSDTWTPNRHWSMTASVRYNRFEITDMDQVSLTSFKGLDPKFLVKFDPTGDNRTLITASFNRTTNDFLHYFTKAFTEGGTSALVRRGWTGAALGQAAPGAANDLVGGVPMYGVRFVDYAALTNPGNWGAPFYFEDARQRKLIKDLAPSYVDEISLGVRRNHARGWVSLTALQRAQRDNWTSYVDYGYENWVLVNDPTGNPSSKPIWQQPTVYTTNPEAQYYRSVEVAWNDRPTSWLTWGGSWNWMELVGDDYYWFDAANNYRSLQALNGVTAENTYSKGPSQKYHNATLFFTAVQRMGRGEVSYSLSGKYQATGVRTLFVYNTFQNVPSMGVDPVYNPIDPATGRATYAVQSVTPAYLRYMGSTNDFHAGGPDTYSWDFKVQWQLPVWRDGRVKLVGSLLIYDIFNNLRRTNYLSPIPTLYTQAGYVRDRLLRYNYGPEGWDGTNAGTVNESSSYTGSNRRVGEFSIGLKF